MLATVITTLIRCHSRNLLGLRCLQSGKPRNSCAGPMLASSRYLGDLHAVYGNRDFQMSFKPTVDQLCTISDMTVGCMTQDFIASRIGVSDEFSAWRLNMITVSVSEDTPPPPPRARQAPMTAERLFEAHEPEKA
jgi:hypothetical protein